MLIVCVITKIPSKQLYGIYKESRGGFSIDARLVLIGIDDVGRARLLRCA